MPVNEKLKASFYFDSNYHIIFKSIDGLNLFNDDKDYEVFKKRWLEFLHPYFINLAYSLMKNHVHLIVKTNTINNVETVIKNIVETKRTIAMHKLLEVTGNEVLFNEMIERQCNRFMVSYANYMANKYKKKGGLFQKPFKRIAINMESHLQKAIIYVNANAQKYKLVSDFKKYRHCGYWESAKNENGFIDSAVVFNLFDGSENFKKLREISKNYFY